MRDTQAVYSNGVISPTTMASVVWTKFPLRSCTFCEKFHRSYHDTRIQPIRRMCKKASRYSSTKSSSSSMLCPTSALWFWRLLTLCACWVNIYVYVTNRYGYFIMWNSPIYTSKSAGMRSYTGAPDMKSYTSVAPVWDKMSHTGSRRYTTFCQHVFKQKVGVAERITSRSGNMYCCVSYWGCK